MAYTIFILGGVIKPTDFSSQHNPDVIINTSCGYIEIDANKSPTGAYRGWWIVVIRLIGDNTCLQFLTQDNAVTLEYYVRKIYKGTPSNWVRLSTI